MTYGLDYAWAKPSPSAIRAGGYTFVSRYLSWLPNSKVIALAEVQALLAEGIDIFLNWEFDAQDALRGAAGGVVDATEAVRQARALGYPAGATIYHSADFDVTDAQKPTVAAYLRAAAAVEGPAGYRTGCYSGYWTVKYLFDNGVIRDGWQTYAWSGGLWDARAALRQIRNGITVDNADCDKDQMVGAACSWLRPDGGGTIVTTPDPTETELLSIELAKAAGAPAATQHGEPWNVDLTAEYARFGAAAAAAVKPQLDALAASLAGLGTALTAVASELDAVKAQIAALPAAAAAPTPQAVAAEVLNEEAARLAQ